MAKFWKNTATYKNCISNGGRYTQIYNVRRQRLWFFDRIDEVQVSGSGNCPPVKIKGSPIQIKQEQAMKRKRKWKTYNCVDKDGTVTTVASQSRGAAKTYLRMNCSGRIRRER